MIILGHKFVLTLDRSARSWTYKPEGLPCNNLPPYLEQVSVFPEHVLSRFLLNVLQCTYKTGD